MKILVTGSLGLVGRSLIPLLKKHNYEIINFDNRYAHDNSDYGDILDINGLLHKMKSCHGVIHLAAVSRVIWGQQDPTKCWQHNVYGVNNIISSALQSPNKPWVLFASSREVYGQQQTFPVKETATLSPCNIYAQSKLHAEEQIIAARSQGLKTAIIRLSSVFGDVHDHASRVVPAFCLAALKGSVLRVEGKDNMCDFTHSSDVALALHAYIKALESDINLPIMHFTSGVGSRLDDLAKLILSLCPDSDARIEYATPRNYDVHRFVGCPENIKQTLGVEVNIDLETRLKTLLAQYQHALSVI